MYPTPIATIALHYLLIFVALVFLIDIAWNVWMSYIETLFLNSIKWVLLEVRPPQDVFKSPLAMELVLNAMQAGGQAGEFHKKYWAGEVSLWYSLEIVSIEGSVRFFIRTPDKFKKGITSQIYAQYPQAEVLEVEDYAQKIPDYKKGGAIDVWGTRQILEKDEVIPIKTYVDYGLDRAVGSLEEEERIDPITPMLEFLGSLGIGETAAMQILIRPATKRFSVKGKDGEEKGKAWTDKAREKIKEINAALKEKDEEGKTVLNRPTKGQSALIESIERNMNKYGFDTAIRMIYVAPKANFDSNRGGSFDGTLRQYNAADLNNFKKEEGTGVAYPWQDVFGLKVDKLKEKAVKGFKARAFFYGSFDFKKMKSYFTHPNVSGGKPFIMSTEELATLFHLPGRVAATPTFERIDAKKSEPPVNLPI
jgi:hypothetical protein